MSGAGASIGRRLSAPWREAKRWWRRLRARFADASPAMTDERPAISVVDVTKLDSLAHDDPGGVLVVMPCIRLRKAQRTARLLAERAGMPCRILLVRDDLRQGFVKTLNAAAARSAAKYIVYLAEDAFPGVDWLRDAFETLERSGKGLLGFNDGKWKGRIAAFGMVRRDWIKTVYGGPVFYSGYVAHKADNELTVIARAQDQYVYNPDCTLIEHDPGKVFRDPVPGDPAMFRRRFREGFDRLVPPGKLAPMAREYFVPWPAGSGVPAGSDGADAATNIRSDALEQDRRDFRDGRNLALTRLVGRLMQDAEAALGRGLYSVTDKTSLPPSGNANDYWHPAPYWWPNPDTADGLPYINRDGVRAPGTRLYEPGSEQFDRSRLQRVFDDSLVLALAWKFSGQAKYAGRGAQIIERFFVDPQTRMTPHLKYAQVRMGHDGNRGTSGGIIEMKDMYYFLDAVRMLIESGALQKDAISGFQEWLSAYLDWLLTSPQGRGEAKAANNHGVYYDLQVAAIAAFLDERAALAASLARTRERIGGHFAADGSQPAELRRNTSAHYCCFNFQGWTNIARLAESRGCDLWSHRAPNGASLQTGAAWLLSHAGKPWPYEQIDEFDPERFVPVRFAWPTGSAVPVPEDDRRMSRLDAKPVFFPHDGIRPYWNLGN